MKNNLLISFLCLALILTLFSFKDAKADAPTGGLWGQYSIGTEYSEFKELKIENIDFTNFDQTLRDTIGRPNNAEIIWDGGIYADTAGTYNIRLYSDGGYSTSLDINNQGIAGWGKSEAEKNIQLKQGWNEIYFGFRVPSWSWDSEVRLFWTPPGKSEQIIPEEKLSYKHWSDTFIKIPSEGVKKKVNYITAGVGTEGKTEATVTLTLPSGIKEENILKNDVWFVSGKDKTASNQISVNSQPITGTENFSALGFQTAYPQFYGKIPSSLIKPDSSGRLTLTFRKTDDWGRGGLGVILPYEDQAMPEGRLSFRLVGASAYRGVSPTMVFPVEESTQSQTLNPLFFLTNGETAFIENFRPNYITMVSGSGSAPTETTNLLKLNKTIIIPESGPINRSNSKTWYPAYGRDGKEFDALSPNAMNSNSKISPITIPAGHTWVAFQYYGSNFERDGVGYWGESASISGGGLFSEKDIDSYELEVKMGGDGSGNIKSNPLGIDCGSGGGACISEFIKGTKVVLRADYDNNLVSFSGWKDYVNGSSMACQEGNNMANTCTFVINEKRIVSVDFNRKTAQLRVEVEGDGTGNVTSNPLGINCGSGGGACVFSFIKGNEVKLSASYNGSLVNFSGWMSDGLFCNEGTNNQNTCTFTMTDDRIVRIAFYKIKPVCGDASNKSFCVRPPKNEELCLRGAVANFRLVGENWEWNCVLGGVAENCSAKRWCGWEEVAP